MQLTPRALILSLLAGIPIALYQISPGLLYVDLIYLLLLAAMYTMDYLTSPLYKQLRVIRVVDSKLSLGAENPIILRIANDSRYPVRVQLKDDFPPEFRFDRAIHERKIAPHSIEEIVYYLKPLRRGNYHFADIHVRCWGVLGFIVRQRTFPAAAEVKVYPNLLEIRKYELLVRRGALHEIGLKSSRLFGTGTELERLREYQPDDDYRRIDWKATARRSKPVTREFETERSQNVIIMLDTGRLMNAQIGDLIKLDYAINTSLMASYICCLKGDKVGLLSFADRVTQYVAPKPGKRQFYQLLEMLYDVRAEMTEASFQHAFEYLAAKHQRRSLILLFTDILDKEAAQSLLTYMSQLSRRHLAMCVTVSDTNILALAKEFPRRSDAVYQKVVAEKLLREKQEALEVLTKRGVIVVDVPAEKLTVAVINKYLELKAKSMI